MLTLPPALRQTDDTEAVALLRQYCRDDNQGRTRTGVQWDTWLFAVSSGIDADWVCSAGSGGCRPTV
ncbi:hypothetical protein, partial [Rhodococcus ruber]|uniref:hypothetical protein n=1 Tax=Rhodococcus ruber TaxID=1830 RepID=UPI002949DF20